MQRHWEGAFIVQRDEMEKRFRELSSVAMLARRDIDRHIWLSECRPDLAPLAPAPPGVQRVMETTKRVRKKKSSSADGPKASRIYSCRGIDDMARSGGRELSDLLRFCSTLDIDLQKLLLEAITKRNSMKTKKKDVVQKDERKVDQELCSLPRRLRRSSCTVLRPSPHPSEDESPCSFREWTHFSKQHNSRGNEKFSSAEEPFSTSPRAVEWTSNSTRRLTNSSDRPRGGCGKMEAEDGVCRDVAIRTRRILPKASKINHKAPDQTWEVNKSFGTAGRLLADHSAQTSQMGVLTRTEHLEEETEKLREETTISILERWAEPLEQYLSTLQKFEQELREKWLNPEEIETTQSNSGAQTGDLESRCIQLTSDSLRASETQAQRITSPDEVEIQPDKPLSSRKLGGSPCDDVTPRPQPSLKQGNFATHESGVIKTPKIPELRDPDEPFHRARPESNAASGSLQGKPQPEYLAAGFRTRKLVEWWPTDKIKPLPTTSKSSRERSKSGPASIFSVYDPRTLMGTKTKREEINPGDKSKPSVQQPRCNPKPEWWPALRRPYSASEIEAIRKREDTTAKASTRKSPSKIFSGYNRARRPAAQSSNRPQRRKPQEIIETNGNQCTPQCVAQQQADDSRKKAVHIQIPTLRLSPRKSHQKAKEHGQKMERPHKAHEHCQNLSTAGELEQLNVNPHSSKCKTGHGGLHALQEHSQFEISNTVEDLVCGMITQLEEQVCEIMTQLQPEQEAEPVPSNLSLYGQLQIKTPREADVQAGDVLAQANVQKEFPTPPMVAPAVDVHNEQHQVEKKRNKRNQSNFCVQQGIERLADKLIDQVVNGVASELAEFCETVADQMYTAEFVT